MQIVAYRAVCNYNLGNIEQSFDDLALYFEKSRTIEQQFLQYFVRSSIRLRRVADVLPLLRSLFARLTVVCRKNDENLADNQSLADGLLSKSDLELPMDALHPARLRHEAAGKTWDKIRSWSVPAIEAVQSLLLDLNFVLVHSFPRPSLTQQGNFEESEALVLIVKNPNVFEQSIRTTLIVRLPTDIYLIQVRDAHF